MKTMTKKELIEALAKYDDDTPIVTLSLDGYDYDDITVKDTWIAFNKGEGGYCGKHKEVEQNEIEAVFCIEIRFYC